MQIREYRESDLAALRAIHAAQGFDYALPDLRNPLFLTKLVLTAEEGGGNSNRNGEAREGNCKVAQASACGSVTQAPAPEVAQASACGSMTLAPASEVAQASCGSVTQASACAPSMTQASAAGPILGAVLLRLTAEAYLLLDPHAGTPRQRWQWLLALQEAARRDAWQRGLEDVHAWLPPPIAQKFGRRLTQLGWLRDDSWTPYCKRLTSPG